MGWDEHHGGSADFDPVCANQDRVRGVRRPWGAPAPALSAHQCALVAFLSDGCGVWVLWTRVRSSSTTAWMSSSDGFHAMHDGHDRALTHGAVEKFRDRYVGSCQPRHLLTICIIRTPAGFAAHMYPVRGVSATTASTPARPRDGTDNMLALVGASRRETGLSEQAMTISPLRVSRTVSLTAVLSGRALRGVRHATVVGCSNGTVDLGHRHRRRRDHPGAHRGRLAAPPIADGDRAGHGRVRQIVTVRQSTSRPCDDGNTVVVDGVPGWRLCRCPARRDRRRAAIFPGRSIAERDLRRQAGVRAGGRDVRAAGLSRLAAPWGRNGTCDGLRHSACTYVCGDSCVELPVGEACDDGNLAIGAACPEIADCSDRECGFDPVCGTSGGVRRRRDLQRRGQREPAEMTCGDGMATGTETCDGTDVGAETCATQGFDAGTLTCNGTCDGFDTSACTYTCGDDGIDPGETCDGADVGTETCETQGFDAGTLGCNATCDGFDTSACTYTCGDGILDPGETCDGTALGMETCETQGFDAGVLGCAATWTLSTPRAAAISAGTATSIPVRAATTGTRGPGTAATQHARSSRAGSARPTSPASATPSAGMAWWWLPRSAMGPTSDSRPVSRWGLIPACWAARSPATPSTPRRASPTCAATEPSIPGRPATTGTPWRGLLRRRLQRRDGRVRRRHAAVQ